MSGHIEFAICPRERVDARLPVERQKNKTARTRHNMARTKASKSRSASRDQSPVRMAVRDASPERAKTPVLPEEPADAVVPPPPEKELSDSEMHMIVRDTLTEARCQPTHFTFLEKAAAYFDTEFLVGRLRADDLRSNVCPAPAKHFVPSEWTILNTCYEPTFTRVVYGHKEDHNRFVVYISNDYAFPRYREWTILPTLKPEDVE